MVSLVERIKYNTSIQENPKVALFSEFLKRVNISYSIGEQTPETDRLYFNLITSCNSDQNGFLEAYNEISRRRPSQDSPWLMNDFLIFTIICGVAKYNIDTGWINEVIEARPEGNLQNKPVNQTFRNLIKGNLLSTDNLFEIVIVFIDIQNDKQLEDQVFNKLYKNISENVSLLNSKNDFLICITLRAYDIIVTTKDTPDAGHNRNLKKFQEKFLKRVTTISNVTYSVLCLLGLFLILYMYKQFPDFKNFISDIGSILAIFGVSLFVFFIKKLRTLIEKFFLFILGYSQSFRS